MYVRALPVVVRFMGLYAPPGVLFVILASVLLFFWEFRRLTGPGKIAARSWLLPTAGIALGVLSAAFITARFVVIR
jgi:hypothetical protein